MDLHGQGGGDTSRAVGSASASGLSGPAASQRPRGGPRARAGEYVCTYWIGGECFALDTVLVAEVVAVAKVLPVPLSPPWLLGLHNLRGTPLVVGDLGRILDLPVGGQPAGGPLNVLVLRTPQVMVGIRIDRIGAVHSYEAARPEATAALEHPAVKGLLKIEARQGLVATLLDEAVVAERLAGLRLRPSGRAPLPGEAVEGAKFHG
jgi:purine-binding chemotaxis protein CheW